MMTIDLSDQTPPPRRGAPKPAQRPTPCAGLFGWRKDAKPLPPEADETKAPGRDYPTG